MRLIPSFLLCLALLAPAARASAHLGLDAPISRYGPDTLKTGPCGVEGGARSENVTYFEPGETIEVRWNEYIQHPGHFRIAFDPEGDDDFVDPATMTELYSNGAVLLDGIPDQGPDRGDYAVEVTLPDVTCDDCTLQVIQVMYDKPPYTTPGNDIYYQCADLVLKVGGAPKGGGDSGGCSASSDGAAASPFVCLLLLFVALRLARASEIHV